MIRLHFIVEGQTEETFVRDVLAPHLSDFMVFADARCVATGRKRNKIFKGGVVSYVSLRKDIRKEAVQTLNRIRESFPTPEHIDDNFPPSKRILEALPDYDKVDDGPILALETGLNYIRGQCPHFRAWISVLETLDQ